MYRSKYIEKTLNQHFTRTLVRRLKLKQVVLVAIICWLAWMYLLISGLAFVSGQTITIYHENGIVTTQISH